MLVMTSDEQKVQDRIQQVKKDTGHGEVLVKIKDRKVVFVSSKLEEEIHV